MPLPAPTALLLSTVLTLLGLAGCSQMPRGGPHLEDIAPAAATAATAASRPAGPAVQLVPLNDAVVRHLAGRQRPPQLAQALPALRAEERVLRPGDAVEITLWESPPATLFGNGLADAPGAPATARSVLLPEQLIDLDGTVQVPFAGAVPAAGQTRQQLAAEIGRRLAGKANRPEALVRQTRHGAASVAVVGEVATSLRLPLTPARERLLDALAAAGGVRQPVHKITVQVSRDGHSVAMPLEQVIQDPRQNVLLQAGDVVTALYQTHSVSVLGATGRNDEIAFEAQGISLAQALARAGGLDDNRASPRGVFIFRYEAADALPWPQPPATGPDGRVPVVYQLDLSDPGSFFVMQHFPVRHQDVLYASNAPANELRKFMALVMSVAYPVFNLVNLSP
ncbi:polysaccharide biosynthesis/export family protein [Ideonella livida]|uniref:Polysaccharide export protein n=1 Tax=Ideonella livida TaxID=2707176 RepID=A0A7C9PH82_9BURK|nr:polysaccharide biosynthesis/export family protein [Ideonella livida]NDY91629.1 polysaccharide export protein [Ideonella livida]